ncbi:MAG: 30S ribosomal protein S7 [Verrucomicrobia bacterium]|nr:30S ribosomal protein S7 [Verrucomicrobiota bacterium]
MARRRGAVKRDVIPDPKYSNELVARTVSCIMRKGKKSVAEKIVYGALDEVQKKMNTDPLEVLVKAVENIKPKVEVKSRRVGGSTYQVPVEINRFRQMALALRWLTQFAGSRKGVPMERALALEIVDAFNNQGNAVRKKDDTHKMAQANKAFAHYAW